MIKVTDLEYFIFIAFTLKFGVKSLLSKGGDTGRGVNVSPCSLALVVNTKDREIQIRIHTVCNFRCFCFLVLKMLLFCFDYNWRLSHDILVIAQFIKLSRELELEG